MSYSDLYLSRPPPAAPSGGGDGGGRPATAAVFGVPFDSTHSYKPGCRFGPDAIREAFHNIEVFHPELGADLEGVPIADLGNAAHTVVASEMVRMVRRITAELAGRYRPLVVLGGEHTVTYGTYMGLPKGTGYVVFDAHYDLRDRYADARMGHASYLRRIVEERGADCIVHVGARAFVGEELEFLTEHGIRTVTDADIRDGRGPGLVRDALSVFDGTYASFDLDVLDPAFAPGVGNPEAEGITSRELFAMIRSMGDCKMVGMDIVEMNPRYDTGATASLAAKIMSTVIAMGLGKR